MLDKKNKTDKLALYCYLYPLGGGLGLGFFIQYRKFERGFDSLLGIRLLILMALFSLIMLWVWKVEGFAVARIFRTSSNKVLKRISYGYGGATLLFFYPLLRRYVLTNWHASFRLMALSVILIMAAFGGIGLLLALRKTDGNREAPFAWSQMLILPCIAVLYYMHQVSYMKTHEIVWSNLAFSNEIRRAITIFPNTSFQFNQVISHRSPGDLSIGIAAINPVKFMQPECRIDLKLIDKGGRILEERSIFTPIQEEWTECHLDVSPNEEENITVDVRCVLFPKEPLRRYLSRLISYSSLPWHEPKGFLIALTRPRILAKKDETFPNVILISIDTLRADYVGAYGESALTPAIDSLADNGILFKNATVPSTKTMPSHMSMMTSLYKSYHGIDDKNIMISDLPLTTVAEVLQNIGYATAAFTGGGYVSAKYGFSKGFDSFYEKAAYFNEAADIFARGESWIKQHGNYKFFLFLHTYEVHNYFYQGKHRMLYTEEDYNGIFKSEPLETLLPNLGMGRIEVSIKNEDIQYIRDLYRGAIRILDEELGKFLMFLREQGLYDEALVILTSDHGEGFGETHASDLPVWHHNREPYQEQVHVPLIIKLPASRTPSERTSMGEWVSTIDIAPTILDACGLSIPPQFQGISLIHLLRMGDNAPNRDIFSEVIYNDPFGIPSSVATYSKSYVYIHYPGANREDELYDLQKDSNQQINLRSKEEGEGLLETINAHLNRSKQHSKIKHEKRPLDEKFSKQLRALGYLD